MGFENLTHVHTGGHAERIQHDLNRGTVFHIGHILFGKDLCDHALVAVTAGHFVADRNNAFGRDVDLDHFKDGLMQLFAAQVSVQCPVTLFDRLLKTRLVSVVNLPHLFDEFRIGDIIRFADLVEIEIARAQDDIGDLTIMAEIDFRIVRFDETMTADLLEFENHRGERVGDRAVSSLFKANLLFFELAQFLVGHSGLFLIAVNADHHPFDARRHHNRIILDIFAGTAENRVEKFLFGSEFLFVLRPVCSSASRDR